MSSLIPIVATLLALVAAAPAQALAPTTEARLGDVVEHVYRGSPHASVPCGPACAALWHAEQGASAQPGLQRELRTLRIAAGLNPRLGALYRLDFGPTELRWRIHRGPSSPAKLLRVGIPAGSATSGLATSRRLEYWGYGEGQRTSGNVALPNNVWVFTYRHAYQTWTHVVGNPAGCMSTTPPPGLLSREGRRNQCVTGATTVSHYVPEDDLTAPAAIEDHSGQTVDRESWAPADPGRQAVSARVRAQLSSARYPELNAWYEAHWSR